MIFDPLTGRLFTADSRSDTVTALAAATGRQLGRYLASLLNDRLTCISLATGAMLDELPVERAPAGLCVSSDGCWLYVCNRDPGTISVLDARSGTESQRITVGNGLGDCAVDPVTSRLLVSNVGGGTLTVVERPWSPRR